MKKSSTFLNLISIVLIVLVVLGVVFYLNPWRTNVETLGAELAAKDAEVASLTARVTELESLREELGSSGVTEEKLLLQVPEGVNQDDLLTDLYDLATEAEITLNGVSFSTTEGEDGAGVVVMSASFDGDYEDLIDFLEAVESSVRKIVVTSISVQLSEDAETPHASFGLAMEAYYQ